jgi:hypothetical protein
VFHGSRAKQQIATFIFKLTISQCLSDSVQLGFLPREVAKWVAPLSDSGFFNFSGFIYPREALEAAYGVTNTKVQLLLYVSKVRQKDFKKPFS